MKLIDLMVKAGLTRKMLQLNQFKVTGNRFLQVLSWVPPIKDHNPRQHLEVPLRNLDRD